uniref:7TM_GPCR_Srx domain-containing protein n=1 Tax=Heterorhabditis bacteriophora TaxID=37862 RepID=A0A1I7XG01_HETBA
MNHMIESICEWMFPIQAALGIGGNILNLMVLLSRPMRSRKSYIYENIIW